MFNWLAGSIVSRLIIGIILLFSALNARDISPAFRLHTSGLVSDFVVDGDRLYAATDMGSVDIFDLSTQQVVDRIVLEPILTAQGEHVPARVHCVDRINGKTLLVSSGQSGYRNVWVYEDHALKKIVDEEKKIFVKEARFADDGHILFGTFGSDMILYDQAEGYQVYRSHISESTLGDIVLSDDKKKMVMSDESGTVRVIDVGSSQVEHTFSSENLDNVYRVAYSKGVIITAGQDRRVGVYPIGGKAYHLRSDFLVYSVALSPDASVGIYSSGVNHDLQLFDIISREKIDRLVGHHAVVNKITFLNEHILISSGDEKDIYIWQLD